MAVTWPCALKDVSLEIQRGETIDTGFHPKLTARKNIYENGVILEMK